MLDGRGMDFETMGAVQGMGRDLARTQGLATQRILEANAELDKANEMNRQLRAELVRAQTALRVETAHSAGLTAQVKTLKSELGRVDAGNKLLAYTGKTYASGTKHISLNLFYEAAFDAKAKELGIADPKTVRASAK